MFAVIFLVYAAVQGTVLGQTNCPSGWTLHGESCYFLHTHDKYDWAESKGFCDSHNAHLAFIDDADENTFVKGMIKTKLPTTGQHGEANTNVWLGATDEIVEGKFMWYSFHGDDEIPVTYTDWQSTEPNSGPLGLTEDCLIYWADYGWQWADLNCDEKEYFVCEKRINEGSIVVG